MKKINNKQQTKKVETKTMLNTWLVHGPSAILELHVQSVRGQNFTRDINLIISSDLQPKMAMEQHESESCSEKTLSHREIVRNSPKSCVTRWNRESWEVCGGPGSVSSGDMKCLHADAAQPLRNHAKCRKKMSFLVISKSPHSKFMLCTALSLVSAAHTVQHNLFFWS